MAAHFIPRPVTPGVAGSSPVHFARKANEISRLHVADFISGSETLEYGAEERGAKEATRLRFCVGGTRARLS